MPIRLSGMNSGLDTDAIIKDLVAAYRTKSEKYVKQKTKLEWKQEAWQGLNTKIYSLYTQTLWKMSLSGNYQKKKTSVSDETKATVEASNSAASGIQELEVLETAKSGYMTGGVISDKNGDKIISKSSSDPTDTTLSELDITFPATIKVSKGDGTSSNIELTEDMTMKDVAKALQDAGLSANFDEKNQRFFVFSKSLGEESDFSLIASDDNGLKALQNLGLYSDSDSNKAEYEKWATYTSTELQNMKDTYNADLDANKDTRKADAYKAKLEQIPKDLENYTKIIKEAPDKITDLQNEFEEAKQALNDALAAGSTATPEDIQELTEKKVAQEKALEKANDDYDDARLKKGEIIAKFYDGSEDNELDEEALEAASDLEVELLIQEEKDDYYIYVDDQHDYAKSMFDTDTNGDLILDPVTSKPTWIDTDLGEKEAVKIDGKDSEIILNGATFKSDSNTHVVNGLTITVKDKTELGEPVTLSTDTDVDGIYDNIKGFLKEYNDLIKEMEKLYGADSAKGYEPLTDEEREAMSEGEIEKWESKIKDSVLRRDSTLGSIVSMMKNSMMQQVEIDGQNYSLSSFGIGTAGFFSSADGEKSVLHIDGDEDDNTTKDKSDKLKSMIASDPELVTSFFTKITESMYDELGKKMKKTEVSSSQVVYSDLLLKDEIEEYEKKVDKWEKYVTAQEDAWYKKFTAMETALSKLQSSTSALSSLLGSGGGQ